MIAVREPGRLHVLTDETIQSIRRHEELAVEAVAGGADVVQYREKRVLSFEHRLLTARRIVEALGTARCVVNDDVEIARESGAWGVHLGAQDRSPAEARSLWPEVRCIGATANDLETARVLDGEGVDYLGVGPVFGTSSKADPAATLGLDRLREIVRAVKTPVIAIGNIDSDNAEDVMATGAWGVAVLSSVVSAEDPRRAVSRIRAAVDHGLVGRMG